MTPSQRRAAGNLLAGACGNDRSSAELGARAAVELTDGLSLSPELALELADRLTGVAAVAAASLKALAGPKVLARVLDAAADGLAALDEQGGA